MTNPSVGDVFLRIPVEWQGRTIELRRPSFDTEARYRHHLESEARAAINRHRAGMDAVEYKAQVAAWQEACAARVYDFGSEAWGRSLGSRDNFVRLLWLIATQRDEAGNPPPTPDLTLAEMDALYGARREELLEAWRRLQEPGPADPRRPVAPADRS